MSKGSAILENRFGAGRAILLSPDLLFSIVHIQQGLRVLQDGKTAPDGSAPLNDGLLKAEDGLVLDWQRDRTPTPPDGGPLFMEPLTTPGPSLNAGQSAVVSGERSGRKHRIPPAPTRSWVSKLTR